MTSGDLDDIFSPAEVEAIQGALAEIDSGVVVVTISDRAQHTLDLFWQMVNAADGQVRERPASYSVADIEDWNVGFSGEFAKETRRLDRKLQGQIFVAIQDILTNPMTVRGDTVKPLERNLKGLWRYRVGDYRIIYRPQPDQRRVELVTFGPRGAVYE